MRVFVRSISAFLFAATLAAIALVAFWYLAMKRAESGLEQALQDAFGGQVSYSKIRWNYDFSQTHLTLEDAVISAKNKSTGVQMTHRIGSADVYRGFFGGNKLVVKLPKTQELSVALAGESPFVYPITMEGGQVSFFTEAGNEEVYFSINTLIVRQKVSNNKVNALFSARDAYLIQKKGLEGGSRLAMKNPKLQIFDKSFHAEDLLFDYDSRNMPGLWGKLILPVLATGDLDVLKKMVVHLAEVSAKSKKKVDVKDLRITLANGTWLAAQGKVGADTRLRPSLNLSFSTNKPPFLYDLIRSYGQFDEALLKEKRFKRTLLGDQSTLTLDVAVNQGALTFNALLAGVLMPVSEVLGVDFEEEVTAP